MEGFQPRVAISVKKVCSPFDTLPNSFTSVCSGTVRGPSVVRQLQQATLAATVARCIALKPPPTLGLFAAIPAVAYNRFSLLAVVRAEPLLHLKPMNSGVILHRKVHTSEECYNQWLLNLTLDTGAAGRDGTHVMLVPLVIFMVPKCRCSTRRRRIS